ncbi:MAG: hypothetical protein OXC84_10905 [Gammaproteobacteria bacterium]|nr:hypothetical protein [Gammaproteobacteria bacterium]
MRTLTQEENGIVTGGSPPMPPDAGYISLAGYFSNSHTPDLPPAGQTICTTPFQNPT